jgi:raffinose synthase
VLYNTPSSSLTRTSDDFFPHRPESHGAHLWNNALVSLWFGEFAHPDWDMFQSGHPPGIFHAIGRAMSGGPVYVSDKPGQQDFALLGKLVLPDGTTLRPQGVGRPTRDCLFRDPLAEPVLLKIFNTNLDAGVIGVFNARLPDDEDRAAGVIRASCAP